MKGCIVYNGEKKVTLILLTILVLTSMSGADASSFCISAGSRRPITAHELWNPSLRYIGGERRNKCGIGPGGFLGYFGRSIPETFISMGILSLRLDIEARWEPSCLRDGAPAMRTLGTTTGSTAPATGRDGEQGAKVHWLPVHNFRS